MIKNNVNGEELVETFYGKELEKTKETRFRIEKVIRKKATNSGLI